MASLGAWSIVLLLLSVLRWCQCDKLDLILAKHSSYCGISTATKQTTDATEQTNGTLSLRIVGGINAERFEFPWQISLRRWSPKMRRWYHTCGGAVIDNQWILTAAHCTLGRNVTADMFRVRVGEHDYSKVEGDELDVNVSKILSHSDFNMISIEPDINLLKLAEPINLGNGSKLNPVCIAKMSPVLVNSTQSEEGDTKENTTTRTCFSSGWGKLKFHGEFPTILQKVPVQLVDPEQCQEAYDGIAEITEGMMCSGQGGKGTCEGDSGGPLQCLQQVDGFHHPEQRWTLHGLTSWAVGCAEEKFPSVAARVALYRDWIANTITDNSD